MRQSSHRHILTFDIEDWFHVIGVPRLEDPAVWPSLPTIVERETDAILDRLGAHDVRATFFIVGWIAERYPALVRRIAASGHEVASHSHLHRTVFSLSPAAFRADLRRSVDAIEQAAGQPVLGFRAPSFSIVPGCEWALEILGEERLAYDASFFPVPRTNGGYPCPPQPHPLRLSCGAQIAEVPMSTLALPGRRVGFSGGGFMRLLPLVAIEHGFAQAEAAGLPVVVYLHPRDFTRDWPLRRLPAARRAAAWIGCPQTGAKLDCLLKKWRFEPCRDHLTRRGLLPPRIGTTFQPNAGERPT